MKITITAEMCRKYNYHDNRDCPLFHALQELGIPVESVGGHGVTLQGGQSYPFDSIYPTGWNCETQRGCAIADKDFIQDIPGLEVELAQ